jgi:putative hydrolase of the HAD superfamily
LLFEHLWLSYQMKVVKPEPEIFRRLLAESGYVAEETLFVDDAPTNCQAAAQWGIRTFLAPIRDDWRTGLTQALMQH